MTAAADHSISEPSVAQTADSAPRSDLELLAARHDDALLVTYERVDGLVVQQVFTTLASAKRKVTRAHDRGLFATLSLVRLVPLPHLTPEDLGRLCGDGP